MKKLIILTVVLVSFCVACKSEENVVENENLEKVDNVVEDNKDIENKYFIEISANEFKNKVNSEEKYIFFIGRNSCPACQNFKPTAMEFANKEKINLYYVNGTNFTSEDWQIIDSIVVVEYIPTIIVSENNNILYNEHGAKSYEQLENIVEEYLK